MSSIRTALILAGVLLVPVVLGGCNQPGAVKLVGGDVVLPADEKSDAFLDRVSDVDVTENDAMRGILLMLDGKDTAKDFAQRVDILTKRGIVNSAWNHDAKRPVTRWKLAYMVYQACKVKGGVTLMLTGPSCRYCLRELQYRKIMPPGFGGTTIKGMEYVAVLSRGDIYRRTGTAPDSVNNSTN